MFIAFWILIAIAALILIGVTAKFIYEILSLTDDMLTDIENEDDTNFKNN